MRGSDSGRARGRPWWLVWLAGALTPLLIGFGGLMVLNELSVRSLDAAHAFECEGCRRPPLPLSPEWIDAYLRAFAICAGLAFALSLIGVGLMAMVERRRERSIWIWLLMGLAAATPLTVAVVGKMIELSGTAHLREHALVAGVIYALALLGAGTSSAVRHRRTRA